ncbi:MAG: triose-phosphate isomerase [Alcanivoracaceae bacterium]|jgi:triosephosphate isomerase|nr:triose-phosphate isomerase [Alcanivoracaceae bacterium]
MARRNIVAGNWKMHGRDTMAAQLAGAVAAAAPACETILCAPFPYLQRVRDALAGSSVQLGAQTLSEHEDGAYTGEISAEMLVDCGCTHVIVGHSERRSLFGEADAQVAAKFLRAREAGLTPILCVGESQAEREAGETEQVVRRQLQAVIDAAGIAAFADTIIAYEPVWAIGTGLTASPEQAQAVHAFIRALLAAQDPAVAERVPVLYGGSVKSDNAAALFAGADIDGGLIGGASLDADSFLAICAATTD